MINLDTPVILRDQALSITDEGQITGSYVTSGNYDHGFIWTMNDELQDLHDLFTHRSYWSKTIPQCINNTGQITGFGTIFGNGHAFLITPTAVTHCVANKNDLLNALAAVESNGEDDIIKIQQGTCYGIFIYASKEPYGVTIEGGYTNECSSWTVNPANTMLDSQNNGPVLVLSAPNMAADFVVDGLTL